MRQCCGEQAGANISAFLSVSLFVYMLYSGIYSAWWSGQNVGLPCQVMCWWAFFQMVIMLTCCACLCCAVGTAIVIKNDQIKKMKAQYEEKAKDLSGPRKEYYDSDVFKQKCDELFDKADVNKDGTLDMRELQDIVKEMLGEEGIAVTPILVECFDDNHNSEVEKDEFVEMMKFVSVMQIQDGRFTVEQAFEVLCLPQTATSSDVSRQYKKLALKYHPDKRPGVDQATVTKDMGEVNDAKAMLDKHFQELKDKSPVKD